LLLRSRHGLRVPHARMPAEEQAGVRGWVAERDTHPRASVACLTDGRRALSRQ
jgi:hypothetical protein